MFYYQPTEEGQWRIDLSQQHADTSALFTNILVGNEKRLKLKYRKKYASLTENTTFRWSASIDIADGLGDLRTGISADLEFSIDRYWQSKIKLGFANAYEASQLATLAATDNVVGLILDYSPTKRERLSLGFNFHDLNNRFGDDIGLGWDSSIRISERLFFSDPGWEIYGGLNVQKFSLNSKPLDKTNLSLQFLNNRPIVSNDFIDTKYAHVGIGQRFSHGVLMSEGATVPSPRYWLDTAIGYNLISARPDVTISSGLGWRILGDDELSFSLDWQSQDVNGDASLQIALGYYYNL